MIDPEFEMWLGETWDRDTAQAESLQKSTNDPLDRFFEHHDIQRCLGHPGHNPHEGTSSRADANVALEDLRNFVKAERQRIPDMTVREIRGSAVQFLRKAADTLAAI